MGKLGFVWVPYHRWVTGWEQTHHRWVGECVAKPLPIGDWIHHLQCIEWENFVASLETRTPFRFFPLAVSPLFALAGGFQGTRGALANHEIPNQKISDRHQLFMYYDLAQQWRLPICANLWIPSTAASLLLRAKVQAWNFMLPQQNGFGPKFLHSLLRQ
jgi:hypothetical protein